MSASTSEPTPDVMASEIEEVKASWLLTVVVYWPSVAAPWVTLAMASSMALARRLRSVEPAVPVLEAVVSWKPRRLSAA